MKVFAVTLQTTIVIKVAAEDEAQARAYVTNGLGEENFPEYPAVLDWGITDVDEEGEDTPYDYDAGQP